MIQDHYATLGIAPTTDDVVIRAAYLALIRYYHPDRNRSAEAGERARTVNAAYAVLSDPCRRAEYDCVRAYFKRPAVVVPSGSSWRARQTSAALLSVTGMMSLVLMAIWLPGMNFESDFQRSRAPQQLKVADVGAGEATIYPAAQAPIIEEASEEPLRPLSETPPELKVATAQHTSVEVASPSSSSEQSASRTANDQVIREPVASPVKRTADLVIVRTVREQELPRCGSAKSSVAAAICRDSDFGALDRQLATFFSQSVRNSNESRRAQLFRDQDRFLNRLNTCASDKCLTKAYLQRMREIADVMAAPMKAAAAPIK